MKATFYTPEGIKIQELVFSITHIKHDWDPCGGNTIIAFNNPYDKESRVRQIVSRCHSNEAFNRRVGITACLHKFIDTYFPSLEYRLVDIHTDSHGDYHLIAISKDEVVGSPSKKQTKKQESAKQNQYWRDLATTIDSPTVAQQMRIRFHKKFWWCKVRGISTAKAVDKFVKTGFQFNIQNTQLSLFTAMIAGNPRIIAEMGQANYSDDDDFKLSDDKLDAFERELSDTI